MSIFRQPLIQNPPPNLQRRDTRSNDHDDDDDHDIDDDDNDDDD